jgi:DNA-binding NarL/FixJ family response regulator
MGGLESWEMRRMSEVTIGAAARTGATALDGDASSQPSTPRILLVQDDSLIRDALRAVLLARGQFTIIGEVGSVEHALQAVDRLHPDLAVTDWVYGIELAAALQARKSPTRVFILTANGTREYVRAAVNSGVWGYALMDLESAELTNGLRAVSAGQMFLRVSGSIMPTLPETLPDPHVQDSPLTNREREVLDLILRGCSNKDIAQGLLISVETVKKHRSNLMGKLKAHGVAELAMAAVSRGLVPA